MAMVINDVSRIRTYTATLGQTVFAVPFEFFDNDDLLVYNNNVLLTYSVSPSSASEYSITGAGVTGGGSVTLGGGGAALNDVIVIASDLAVKRLTDFPASGPFQIVSLNDELDALTIMIGQNESHFDRVLEAPLGEVVPALPGANDRANKYLAFDINGEPVAEPATNVDLVAKADVNTTLGVDTVIGHLGAFTGITIPDNVAVKPALQELETAVEDKPSAAVIVATAAADNTAAIQAEIVDLMYTATGNARSRKLRLMTGTSILSDTIHLGYGVAEFRGIWLYGEGNSYGGNLDQHAGTVLACSHTDRPGINIQGARNSGIKDIYIEGVAVDAFSTITVDFDASDPLAAFTAAMTASTVTAGRQYAPYSGITVDAYSGTAPGTAYPNVTFPAAVGTPAQYGKTDSSLITLDNVTVKGFEVGVTFKPCNTSAQGDWLKTVGQVQLENCVYGLSIGNNQFRSSIVAPIRFRNLHTCLVTNKHGEQSGRAPTEIYMETSSLVYQLFEFGSLNAITSCHIHGNCETLVRLGKITGGGSGGAGVLKFSGKYNFLDSETSQSYGVPAKLIDGGLDAGPVVYDASEHEIFGAHYHEPPGAQADNLYIKQGEAATKSYMQMGYNALSGGFLANIFQDREQKICFIPYQIGTGAVGPKITTHDYAFTSRDYCIPISVKRARFSSGLSGWFDKQNRFYPSYVIGAAAQISSYVRTDRSVSWVNGRLSGADIGAKRNLVNGCVAFHDATGTIAIVRSNNPATGAQTLELMNNYIYNGAGFDLIDTSTAFTAGNWYFFPGHLFAPPKRIYGDLTSGSGVITNVRTDGDTDVADYGLAVGDRLATEYYDQDYQVIGSTSSNQPITAIDTVANTITSGRNFSVTKTGVALDFWLRAEPANEASR